MKYTTAQKIRIKRREKARMNEIHKRAKGSGKSPSAFLRLEKAEAQLNDTFRVSDTPRTDAIWDEWEMDPSNPVEVVPLEFARELERELNAATACKHPTRRGSMKDGVFNERCAICGNELRVLGEFMLYCPGHVAPFYPK